MVLCNDCSRTLSGGVGSIRKQCPGLLVDDSLVGEMLLPMLLKGQSSALDIPRVAICNCPLPAARYIKLDILKHRSCPQTHRAYARITPERCEQLVRKRSGWFASGPGLKGFEGV